MAIDPIFKISDSQLSALLHGDERSDKGYVERVLRELGLWKFEYQDAYLVGIFRKRRDGTMLSQEDFERAGVPNEVTIIEVVRAAFELLQPEEVGDASEQAGDPHTAGNAA